LLEHPSVVEAVVIGIPDEEWGQQVGAAVVLAPDSHVAIETLITFARERLAKYKVPRTVKIVSEFPRNAGGKVLRNEVQGFFRV
jgi:acyl-CoA synthetase (AMP-forming)/AMP-acid ligase II